MIGNVPFADVKLEHHGQRLSLHDFFFAKSIDALRPGGVLALVTSHFTLDKQNAASPRVPRRESGFSGGDPAALRRLQAGRDRAWSPTSCSCGNVPPERNHGMSIPPGSRSQPLDIEGAEIPINRYFLDHPEMVLGTWSRKDRLYDAGYSVDRERRPGRAARGRHPPPARGDSFPGNLP